MHACALHVADMLCRLLWLVSYAPIFIVLILIFFAMPVVYTQLKGSGGNKQVARVKSKVLLVSNWYFGSFFAYYFTLLICYLVGYNVHTCDNPPPPCVAWTGWSCTDRHNSIPLFTAQKAFMFVFCARGVLDFVVFIFFSYQKLILRLKDKEYGGQDSSSRSQKLELHDAYRKEIMNMIQIGIARSAIDTHKILERVTQEAADGSGRVPGRTSERPELTDADFAEIEEVDVLKSLGAHGQVQVVVLVDPSPTAPSQAPAAFQKRDIKFQALAPKVFESIRNSASISATEYAEAMNPSSSSASEAFNIEQSQANVLIEKLSEGKGGAFFYFSQNYKFVIKTISDGEYNFMGSILRKMWKQMVRDDTLLSRYFGVYTLYYRGADIKIVVMENVSYMYPRLPIHRKYDLKGSWVARSMTKANEAHKMPTDADKRTLKDMDMRYTIAVSSKTRAELIQAIQKDVDFLAEAGIMDYSLFLSFHIKPPNESLGSERLDLVDAVLPGFSSKRVDSAGSTKSLRGAFREHKGGLAVQLNLSHPFEFLRRPDGRPVRKERLRHTSKIKTLNS
jgi:hypothetical protein